jgi:hypothetical protein
MGEIHQGQTFVLLGFDWQSRHEKLEVKNTVILALVKTNLSFIT